MVEPIESELVDAYIRIGIAVVHLARQSLTSDLALVLKDGRIDVGDCSVGTTGVEPTAEDWERLVMMVSR